MKRIIWLKIVLIISLIFTLSGCDVLSNLKPEHTAPPISNNNEDQVDPNKNDQDKDEKEIIDKDGLFIERDDVALYIYTYGQLPQNYITKSQVQKHISRHWTPQNKMSVGGDIFHNWERLLPVKSGRIYYEADINYRGQSNRGRERIVFSNDGLIFYTNDHYESFVKYDPENKSWKSY